MNISDQIADQSTFDEYVFKCVRRLIMIVIGYTSRESATKALEKMSGKEVDGQTVQVTLAEEKQEAGGKNSEATKEAERSPSEERSRSRTNSGSSASGDEEKKNGSIDGNERSGGTKVGSDSRKKAKNGEEHIGSGATTNNTRNNRKRTSGVSEDGEKNGDDSETSNDAVTPEPKKKKSDTEETETTEVDSTAAVGAE
ncbi:unnamed protein product [Litomosoides sigmodontis]|uniref:RRM domain-containing protein n=1 Tax=Litomosoides sigmodontis TaxID=42156 RepID=A0A3P6V848_LITSI|nr:unnamed protein product [Litomosoides sigmodontis]